MILTLTTGRAGSSMVSGVFEKHGVWVGNVRKADPYNKKGYFENRDIKRLQYQLFGRNLLGDFPEPTDQWITELQKIIMPEPCLFKTGAFFHKLWEPFNPKIVKIFRPIEDVLDSYKRCEYLKEYSEEEREFIVRRQYEAMKTLDGVWVYTQELIDGNYSTLKDAFAYCDIEFDQAITQGFIDEELWGV